MTWAYDILRRIPSGANEIAKLKRYCWQIFSFIYNGNMCIKTSPNCVCRASDLRDPVHHMKRKPDKVGLEMRQAHKKVFMILMSKTNSPSGSLPAVGMSMTPGKPKLPGTVRLIAEHQHYLLCKQSVSKSKQMHITHSGFFGSTLISPFCNFFWLQ